MRIISFFPRPIPSTLTEGLKDIAQLQYWQDLSDEDKNNLDDVRIVITNPPIRMDNELLTRLPICRWWQASVSATTNLISKP